MSLVAVPLCERVEPITTAQLQAEIERMAKNGRDRGMLRELFTALGDDPV